MIEVRHAGAKGFGVFAKALIPRGSRLLAESSLISIDNHKPSILRAARQLTSRDHQKLLALSPNPVKRRSILSNLEAALLSLPRVERHAVNLNTLNIFRNNNFGLSDDAGTRAVFETVARINHSCVPNSQGNFHTGIGQFVVHALRPIPCGDEITISYLDDQLAGGEARREHLEEGYGFTCACSLCGGGSSITAKSESRRADLQRDLGVFAEAKAARDGQTAVTDADADVELVMMNTLIAAYEAEGLAGRELATIYLAAADLAAKLGDSTMAQSLARRGLQLELDAVGVDSPHYIASAAAAQSLVSDDI
ncbi:Uu.00g042480.m01.CDS01 [Anthostomella pinea]|uniref:Uu.00g042480.m01.CDS01 n=1 Tax=Anthostomella pinea TaxID=933095 RepID=A0AAI8VAL1_9PEZI|nr:Uu.00g042480.m01.CDS01 [Anthostomella pinea]